jgi:hypothetical protein
MIPGTEYSLPSILIVSAIVAPFYNNITVEIAFVNFIHQSEKVNPPSVNSMYKYPSYCTNDWINPQLLSITGPVGFAAKSFIFLDLSFL